MEERAWPGRERPTLSKSRSRRCRRQRARILRFRHLQPSSRADRRALCSRSDDQPSCSSRSRPSASASSRGPLGGLVIGRIADRRGRKPAMILTFTLMGSRIVGLALTPSYAMIGMAAPVLAVLFRMIQGFALGGEVGPNAAFLVEAAPPHRRGLYRLAPIRDAEFSMLVAGAVGLLLSSRLEPGRSSTPGAGASPSWSGALIVPFTDRMRRTLGETLVPRTNRTPEGHPPLAGMDRSSSPGCCSSPGRRSAITPSITSRPTRRRRSHGGQHRVRLDRPARPRQTSGSISSRAGWPTVTGASPSRCPHGLLLFLLAIPAFLVMVQFRNARRFIR